MRKLFFLVAIIATAFTTSLFAQDSASQTPLTNLLTHYYDIKDALVAGNAGNASVSASQFLKTANAIDYKVISEGNLTALVKDATVISESNNIQKQRETFANLSANMGALAKSVKLSANPVYLAYCPMKKASWLSNDKTIKNPYYGSAMLSCGEVKETIQ